MRRQGAAIAAFMFVISGPPGARAERGEAAAAIDVDSVSAYGDDAVDEEEFPIPVRPGTLADHIDSLAGHSVRVPYARVVGVFDPRVFLIESQTLVPSLVRHRDRVLVFIDRGTLRVDPATLVASTVTVSGVARTLLGMQVNQDVPWPAALTRNQVERLEVKAAVLASSVRTAEGIDLTTRSSPASAAPAPAPPPRPTESLRARAQSQR